MLSMCLLNNAVKATTACAAWRSFGVALVKQQGTYVRYSTLAQKCNPILCSSRLGTNQISTKLLQAFRQTTTNAKSAVAGRFADITPQAQKQVGTWLLVCAGMCYGAVVIGGITRLTESGLSMTQWSLIKGMKPPTTQEEWEAEFARYKTFPEYEHVHKELTLEGFKGIFFWEYIHRMWGRSIGLVFALPALYFLKRGYVTKSLKPRLGIYGAFILFQGLLGWYMVKSGLSPKPGPNDVPRVSQYRLCAHLTSAMALYALFLWQGLTHLLRPHVLPDIAKLVTLRKAAHGVMGLVFFTAVSGAFVAGLDAGLTYNTWPKMADRWIPDDLFAFSPKWKNILENPTTVQFSHRHLGEFTAAVVLGVWVMTRRVKLPPRARIAAHALAGMALIQVGLGVATLLMFVPVHMAATHQAGAMTLLSFAIWLTHELRRIPK